MLFGLVGQVLRPFLRRGMAPLMNEVHLQQTLALGLVSLVGLLFDGLCLVAGTGQGPNPVWGLYMSQILGLRSQYIRSFSIIGVPPL